MVDTELRVLTREEELVLDAIIAQWRSSCNDIFKYDYDKAQQYLTVSGISKKCIIDIRKHHKIIEKLSNDNIINLDYIVKVNPPDTPSIFNSNISYIEHELNTFIATYLIPKPIVYWANQTDWAYDYFQKDGRLSIEQLYEKVGPATYIKMTQEDVSNIEEKYKARYPVELGLCGAPACLTIGINHKKIIRLRQMYDQQLPFQVLKHAYENRDQRITRDDLRKADIKIGKKSIKSQIFERNKTVLALCPLFLEMDNDSIIFKTKPVKLSLAKLNELKSTLGVC